MDPSNLHGFEKYVAGTIVSGHVRRLLHYGAEVLLEDGMPGIIRNRELSWGAEPEDPGKMLTEGQAVTALVLKVDEERGRVELSLRQAELDPWHDIGRRYQVGQVVRAKVVRLCPRGAFVGLDPGVDAFLSITETRSPPPEHIEDVLWVGDTIEGVITRMDFRFRRISLSIAKYVKRLEQKRADDGLRTYLRDQGQESATVADALGEKERQALLALVSRSPARGEGKPRPAYRAQSPLAKALDRILIVDDDGSAAHSLQRVLDRWGYQVEVSGNADEAITLISEREFNLVLLDLSLGGSSLDGIAAAHQMLALRASLAIVVIAGMDSLERHTTALEEARRIGARSSILRPVDWDRLQLVMKYIAEGKDAWEVAQIPQEVGESLKFWEQSPEFASTEQGSMDVLLRQLAELQRRTGASAAVIFRLNLAAREVRVFAHSGATLENYEDGKYNLQATPVDEVIRRRTPLFEPDVSRNPYRFRYFRLLDFGSCVGVPVRSHGQEQYGLFLFHPQHGHFTSAHLGQAQESAERIGVTIAWKEVGEVIRRAQPLILIGQVGSGLVHDINNHLDSLQQEARILAADREMLDRDPTMILDGRVRDRMGTCVSRIAEVGRSMGAVTDLYLSLMRKDREGATDVNDVVDQAVHFLESFAVDNKVSITTDLQEHLPATLLSAVRLEQVFINLMLNAVQQMHLAKGGGDLAVRTSFEPGESGLPIKIRINDTGPGIHDQHLGQLFTLGFSTRPGGTGLGLFIARGLVESLGGRISLENTVMLLGTTFLVELPIVVPVGKGATP
jgi:signal transduction histidine kinase